MADPEDLEVEQAVRDTETQIMDEAFAPDKPEAEETPLPERPRDPDTGRFTRAAPPATEETPPPEGVPQEGEADERPGEQVPSWRLREIAEERRQIQAERDALRADNARMQAYVAQFQRQQQATQAPPSIDPVLDPQGFISPVKPITSSCIGCHVTAEASSHALANTTTLGESCGVCHSTGSAFAVDKSHAQY